MRFLLDTNFLLLPGRLKADVFAELRQFEGRRELLTIDLVAAELQRLAAGRSKTARAAQLAMHLMRAYRVAIVPTHGTDADGELIREAGRERAAVCTQDILLRKRLRARGLPAVYLRQGRVLVLEG